MKPLLVYVDDEPNNLVVFEASFGDDFQVQVFDSPLKTLEYCSQHEVGVVVSDQRMPGMTGVAFLEIIKKTNPYAQRVLVTGYSDEDLIIESVRKAQVHDYIRKPWDPDDLEHRLNKLFETYRLEKDLREASEKLKTQNETLNKLMLELHASKEKEELYRKELEAWAPPFILSTLFQDHVRFPLRQDLAVVTFDIVESSSLHDVYVQGKPVRGWVLNAFESAVIKHGGWTESTSGDSAYAHFGLVKLSDNPCDVAYAVASEFRTFLRNFYNIHGIQVECGIGLHLATSCTIDVHQVEIHTPKGLVVQKTLDSTSPDIDLVHRMEKMTHLLSGSNIVMSEAFVQQLSHAPHGAIELGLFKLKGQAHAVKVFLKAGDRAQKEMIEHLKAQSLPADTKAEDNAA